LAGSKQRHNGIVYSAGAQMKHIRSLLAQSLLWIILPLSMVVISIILAGTFTYQQIVASLLIDRDRQLATLSATRVSQALNGYALSLQTFSQQALPYSAIDMLAEVKLDPPEEIKANFNAGVILVDKYGQVLTSTPTIIDPLGTSVDQQNFFSSVRENKKATFSDVLVDKRTGQDMVVIAMPVLDNQGQFKGALLGAIHLHTTPLSDPILKLSVGDEGFAYMVDSQGRAVFHPDPYEVGLDFSDREAVARVIAGETGGLLWESPEGERLVQGFAPVEGTSWGLIVREPWEAVIEPIQHFEAAAGGAIVLTLIIAALLLWRGTLRITSPIRSLVAQTRKLAEGEKIEPIPPSGLLEVDMLGQAFDQMAARITSYRAGLRRYVGAITTSQEEERKRIARELHDETVQNLVAILRRIELLQTHEANPEDLKRLRELQDTVEETLRGVRQISRDLRPLALEDLGFIPALQTQVNMAQEGGLQVQLTVQGQPCKLLPDQELALYRIAQEALTNARKHAKATRIDITLLFKSEFVQLEIVDNGVGFSVPPSLTELAHHDNFGLLGIQERVWSVGGSLEISSSLGEGTRLNIQVPQNNEKPTNESNFPD
jgi:signal transduction histidine kinase